MNLFLSVKDKVSLIIKIGEKSECSLQIIDEPDFSVLFCYESTHPVIGQLQKHIASNWLRGLVCDITCYGLPSWE